MLERIRTAAILCKLRLQSAAILLMQLQSVDQPAWLTQLKLSTAEDA